MNKTISGSLRKIMGVLQKAFSSKKRFKEFLLVQLILRFEYIRKAHILISQLRLGKSAKITAECPNEVVRPAIDKLKKEGYVIFENTISESVIESIKKQVEGLSCFDGYNKEVGEFKINAVPESVNIAGYKSSDLASIPEIMQIANDPAILGIVQEYFGCIPTLTGIEMWWSLAGRAKPQFAQLFHRDFDGLKFLKLFVYLSDVSESNGPHVYVTGSANLKIMRRPKRYSDEQITEIFPATQIKKMCGKKGMMFLEDTFGLHKGTLPIHQDRLILQAVYGIHPLPYGDYIQQNLSPLPYDRYINRLYLTAN